MSLTTIMIPDKLHEQVKKEGINISQTCISALESAVSKENVIEEKREERSELLRRARALKHEIDDLEELKYKEEQVLGMEKERIAEAMKVLLGIYDRTGTISDKQIEFQASENNIQFNRLRKEFWLKINAEEEI